MKQLLKYTILALLLSFGQAVISQDYLKIITYNIQGMKPGTSPGLRLGFIIEKLKALDPDIIALQEVNEDLNGNNDDNQGIVITAALSDYFGTEYYYYQPNALMYKPTPLLHPAGNHYNQYYQY